jgi:hypothetical protein
LDENVVLRFHESLSFMGLVTYANSGSMGVGRNILTAKWSVGEVKSSFVLLSVTQVRASYLGNVRTTEEGNREFKED